MSTNPDPPAYTELHGEAVRRFVARSRVAGDLRSPLALLSDVMSRAQALTLIPLLLEADARAGDVDLVELFSPRPRKPRHVDGDCT